MRDILTALAGAVILILVAALAAPPFIDWSGQRALIDRTIGASLGVLVRSDGRIEVRLLPSPRLRLDRVQVGGRTGGPSLDVQFVKAELALMPLLKGEFRFTETRIGRAEMKLPVTDSDAIILPATLSKAMVQRDLVIEDLRIQQALVTTTVPATGRTDQFHAEGLRLKAPSLNGPWQAEGASGGIPFRLATSAITADGASVKFSGGGETKPRFEADTRIILRALDRDADAAAVAASKLRTLVPEADGSARLVVGVTNQAAGTGLPFTIAGKFKARGGQVRFEEVTAEIDPAGQAARLSGTGRIDLRGWRAGLDLETRRLNLDGLIFSSAGQALLARGLGSDGPVLPIALDLDLRLESLALGFENWSDLRFGGSFDRAGGLALRHLSGTAPGATRVEASGEIALSPALRFNGKLGANTTKSDGIGRYLGQLGIDSPALSLLDGRPVQASSDVDVIAADLSLRNLSLTLGEARVTGNARYTKPESDARGRLEAQLTARGIDIAALPPLDGVLSSLDRHDVGLKIQARDLRYGPAGQRSGSGTVAASIQSDGASLVVDSLDIRDLAGTNATLSGRIAPDGIGRIAGRINAPSAAPLLALLDRLGLPEIGLLPTVFREGALALDVSLERESADTQALRIGAKGEMAGSRIDAELRARGGRLERLDARLATPQTGRWFARDDIPGLRQPTSLKLAASRAPTGGAEASPLRLSVEGTLAGLSLATTQPILLDSESKPPRSGTLRVTGADLTPFLALAGAAVAAPVPAEFSIGLSRAGADGSGSRVQVTGRLAGSEIATSLDRAGDGSVSGTATLGALSLPALTAALVLPPEAGNAQTDESGWQTARFARPASLPRTDLALGVGRLDLGRGFVATETRFGLALDGEALTLREFSGRLGGGTLAGSTTITRNGGNASVSGKGSLRNAAIKDLAGDSALRGWISASLRYSGTGDSLAALLGNLGGSGEITLSDLVMPGGDPAAIDRALARALGQDDPLREGQLQALLSDELSTAPLVAKGPVTATATLVGGALRSGPVELDLGGARWSGSFALDLLQRRLDARGTLTSANGPKGWSGGKPSVQLGFNGPLGAPQRVLDAGSVANGLAALVLQRELEKIEQFEADQVDRQRRRARIEMDKARAAALKAAADKAAAEKAAAERAAEEAARAARLRAQQAAAEEARRARERREAEEAARRARFEPEGTPAQNDEPLDLRPAPP